jgi:predicted metal-dependent hydrolase
MLVPSPNQDRTQLKRRAMEWAARLNVKPRVVQVRAMTRKWGSCSTAGTITLAADLVNESEKFQDFVVAHELLHLRVPNHSRLFKALMTAHVPGWRQFEVLR